MYFRWLLPRPPDDNHSPFGYYGLVKLFENIIHARFTSRPNRFVVECLLDGRTVRAYLPNPGRLWELLFPGATLYVSRFPPSSERRLKYLAVAVERDGLPVMLHTHHTNTIAAKLIREGRIPGLEGAEIVKPEYRIGHSRFDFLLRMGGRDFLLEVKSCTLFHDTLAMFPDAVSARATKHLLELSDLSKNGYSTGVLFIVHSPRVRFFMPEHHTDLEFSRTLHDVKDSVMVRAVSVEWKRVLTLGDTVRDLEIPWDIVDRESHDRGSYIVVLRLPRDRKITVGGLGDVKFRKGYYLYAGSARKDLTQRLARHQRQTKKHHWHIDHLREHAEYIAGIPIRTSADLECEVAGALSRLSDWQVQGFGCSDCSCPTHLFGMTNDPFQARTFSEMLLQCRMGRLEEELSCRKVTPR
jgi:sugar fermentation stimulation protein A